MEKPLCAGGELHFVRLTDADDARFPAAMALYAESFPLHEQRLLPSQRAILGDARYRFALVCDGAEWVGLLLCWNTADFVYVEHFCIRPDKRNQQYGARALALLEAGGKPVILEIDPPEDAISRRRAAFYARCGFAENPYPHVHPPYRAGQEGHRLTVLSAPQRLDEAAYRAFARFLRETVMRNCF